MFAPEGPSVAELAVQALSSVERGYDLLAPTFDATPFRTPVPLLDAVVAAVRPLGPFRSGLDLCCGTGAGVGALREVCVEDVTGVDFSAVMLARAARSYRSVAGGPRQRWVRADVRALPFRAAFDLVTSFGAFGHFLPEERPALFGRVHTALRPGGVFAFPFPAPPPVGSPTYWALWGFDAVMRVRNAVRRPPFVMYYRTFRLVEVAAELRSVGFTVDLLPAGSLGSRQDGSARCATLVARRS